MELLNLYIKYLSDMFIICGTIGTTANGSLIINSISKSLLKRKENKKRNLKIYKNAIATQAEIDNNIINFWKTLLNAQNQTKEDYIQIINSLDYPDELKDIVKTFIQNIDEKNLLKCARNLKTVKINKKDITNDLIEYIKHSIKDKRAGGYYMPYTNTIELFYKSKSILSHEFIHMCSSRKYDCGFNIYRNEEIGRGLNEGYTELLNQRIFKYKKFSYPKNVNILKLIETFFDDPKELENAFFNNDLDTVFAQFCKYGTKEEFFYILETLDNFATAPLPINDFLEYNKLKFKLYEIIKRSNDTNKIKNFENILFQSTLCKILNNGYTLTSPKLTAKRLK